ncbi:ABC transporter permease [Pseudobdellovibrio exovorus]|uniref:Pilus biogenesis protein and ABC-type transporter n=1 Tax=Pseudobdellovibrio exovorus JSS TaxID=1184267 RepID=M4VAE6_9BACT|nr:ABC transporter permease subunit [Pseudobdellovibrio exovorus]AGH94971.1 pilus biogenesis protein and ABC-type transporter [Pseudobdellovibrio exovorus JSS]
MKQILTIPILAVLNIREWVRLKFFYIIVFFGILFIAFSHILSALTFSVQERLLYDFGLAGLEIGVLVISSLIGSHSIQREIDRKTLFVILARPIPRSHVVIGAWLSTLGLCLLFSFGFLLSFTLSAEVSGRYYQGLLVAAVSTSLKAAIISSFAIAFSLIVRPILALGATVSYWLLCYSMPDVRFFVSKMEDAALMKVVDVIDLLLPKFYLFNWKSYYYVTNIPAGQDILWAVVHSMAWALTWLVVGILFFRRKEIV